MSNLAGKESQYMFSHFELGSDPPIGSDQESRCDTYFVGPCPNIEIPLTINSVQNNLGLTH